MGFKKKRIGFKKHFYSFFAITVILALIPVITFLVKKGINSKDSKAVTPVEQRWQYLIENWPVSDPDTVDVWEYPLGSGKLAQMLMKGNTWYVRTDITSTNWNTGTNFTEGMMEPSVPPPTSLDSSAVYYIDGVQQHTVTKDGYYYFHTGSNKWRGPTKIFTGETSTCGQNLPKSIDTMTVFPWKGDIGQTFTKDGVFYLREDAKKTNWTSPWSKCGYPIPNERPTKFIGHSTFLYNGKLAELFIAPGGISWFFPDVYDRYTFYKKGNDSTITFSGDIVWNAGSISPYLFGINLVWHTPHNPLSRTATENIIRNLGVKIIRFPGGCGSDAYQWNDTTSPISPNNLSGTTLNEFISIVKNTNVEPFYTFNIEREGSPNHVNLNCHNLQDYGGSIQEIATIYDLFKNQGVTLKHVEVANEPYAKDLDQWNETWNSQVYANALVTAHNALKNKNPLINVIASTHSRRPDENREVWENAVKGKNLSNITAYQLHPYVDTPPIGISNTVPNQEPTCFTLVLWTTNEESLLDAVFICQSTLWRPGDLFSHGCHICSKNCTTVLKI